MSEGIEGERVWRLAVDATGGRGPFCGLAAFAVQLLDLGPFSLGSFFSGGLGIVCCRWPVRDWGCF